MKTGTQNRDGTQPTPWVRSILERFGPDPLVGSPASPTLPERICGGDTFAGALVIDPERSPEADCVPPVQRGCHRQIQQHWDAVMLTPGAPTLLG